MEHLLLIAEKPSLMNEIRTAYNNNKKTIPYKIDFTALAGHICCYAKPNEYKEWDKKWIDLVPHLPMIPEKWTINIMSDKKKIHSSILEKIKENNYDGIICATDADREGNLIFHLLENKLPKKIKTYRLWINDLTESSIIKGLLSMVDFHEDNFQKNLTYASILRSRFDWLVGMNISVSASVKSSMTMKIGRVKTPTLKIVYDNCKAIDKFIPTTSYGIQDNYGDFTGVLVDENGAEITFETKQKADDLISKLTDTTLVIDVDKKETKTLPPSLYELSDIQIEASKKLGFTANKTLDVVQSLYEKKLVSYPRCDCRYISSELANQFPVLLNAVSAIPSFETFVRQIKPADREKVKHTKKYVNDVEVNKNSHTALVPTGEIPVMDNLSDDEQKILKMIFARFLAIFLPPLIEEKTVVDLENNGYRFKAYGKRVKDKGFTDLYKKELNDYIIPDNIKPGIKIQVKEHIVKEKITTPPARLTQGELIKAMKMASKYITDDKLKNIMKETSGIGTQATRGAIIDSLIHDGYIETKGSKKAQALYITEKGKQYIENLDGFTIVSPELTAVWEDKLKQVEQGEKSSTEFSNEMKKYIVEVIQQINNSKMTSGPLNKQVSTQAEPLGFCPRCRNPIVETPKAFSCTGYKNEPACKFAIWKDNKFLASQKKRLTANKVKQLLKNGYYTEKNLTSKTGEKYDAKIVLEDTGTYVNLKMQFNDKKQN